MVFAPGCTVTGGGFKTGEERANVLLLACCYQEGTAREVSAVHSQEKRGANAH